jgi:DNA recombination protein RmuC
MILYNKNSLLARALSDNDELKLANQDLNNKIISYMIDAERLSSELHYSQNQLKDFEQTKKDAFMAAQQNFNEVSQNLTKQLLEMQKQETKANLDLTEQAINKAVNNVKVDFEKISNMVVTLNSELQGAKVTHEAIKKSLLSPVATGQLAEITLVNILTSAGLQNNIDFFVQNSVSTEDNVRLRPDVILSLPDHILIIDAKSSKFFTDFESQEQQSEANRLEENLVKSMLNHIKSLSSKDYAQVIISSAHFNKEQKANITTIMFLPTESFIEKLINYDNQFLTKAWAAGVFPVGPAGLMNLLLLAKRRISEQNKLANYQEILIEVQKLLDATEVIFDHSMRVGSNIQTLVGSYDKFSASFNRNFLGKVEKLKKMGLTTKNNNRLVLKRYHVIGDFNDTTIELDE